VLPTDTLRFTLRHDNICCLRKIEQNAWGNEALTQNTMCSSDEPAAVSMDVKAGVASAQPSYQLIMKLISYPLSLRRPCMGQAGSMVVRPQNHSLACCRHPRSDPKTGAGTKFLKTIFLLFACLSASFIGLKITLNDK
jgi:hypothetical protein